MVNGEYTPDDYRNAVKREKQKRLVAETIWLQYLNDCFLKAGLQFHLKHLDNRVYYMRFHYNGDNYHIIYGYGIDSSKGTWDNCKVRYLGKRAARKVDNLYARLITK